MKEIKPIVICLGLLIALAGCKKEEPNTVQPLVSATELDEGLLTFHGAYYAEEGIEQNVFEMDLLSAGLNYTEEGRIVGTGTNLYFSDIFVLSTDSTLVAGTYTANKSTEPGTFLPGIKYDNNYSGAYLLNIVDTVVQEIHLIESGTFTLQKEGEKTHITFDLQTTEGKQYNGTFKGKL